MRRTPQSPACLALPSDSWRYRQHGHAKLQAVESWSGGCEEEVVVVVVEEAT